MKILQIYLTLLITYYLSFYFIKIIKILHIELFNCYHQNRIYDKGLISKQIRYFSSYFCVKMTTAFLSFLVPNYAIYPFLLFLVFQIHGPLFSNCYYICRLCACVHMCMHVCYIYFLKYNQEPGQSIQYYWYVCFQGWILDIGWPVVNL